jgi:hypothetical protein
MMRLVKYTATSGSAPPSRPSTVSGLRSIASTALKMEPAVTVTYMFASCKGSGIDKAAAAAAAAVAVVSVRIRIVRHSGQLYSSESVAGSFNYSCRWLSLRTVQNSAMRLCSAMIPEIQAQCRAIASSYCSVECVNAQWC